MVSTWSIVQIDLEENDEIGRSWLAEPLAVSSEQLVFSGYVENCSSNMNIYILYGAEVLAHVPINPGFLVAVPARGSLYFVELRRGEKRLGFWEVASKECEDYALSGLTKQSQSGEEITGIGNPYAFYGRMGQLFLGGDSNNSIGQFTENRMLNVNSVAGWTATFNLFSFWKQQYNLDNLSVLIAPAKEEIFRECYPFPRATHTLLDDFMALFHEREVILPKWELWNGRLLAYSNTDTHWTDYGATTGAKAVLRAWNISETELPFSFCVKQRIGDLGNKVSPKVASFEICFLPEIAKRMVFDNGISNHGCIRVFQNIDASISESLLIFGDSFGTNLAQAFTNIFREVTYVYQPAGFDPSLVKLIKPRYVLLEITQRFLHGQPASGHSVFDTIKKRFDQMALDVQKDLIKNTKLKYPSFCHLIAPLSDV